MQTATVSAPSPSSARTASRSDRYESMPATSTPWMIVSVIECSPERHRFDDRVGHRDVVLVEPEGQSVEPSREQRVRSPRVVFGADHRRPTTQRQADQSGDRGDHRRVHVDDVDAMRCQIRAKSPGPSEIERIRDTERHGVHADVLDHRDQMVLPVEDVSGGEPEPALISDAGDRHEKMLGATRAQALDEPQHVDPLVDCFRHT